MNIYAHFQSKNGTKAITFGAALIFVAYIAMFQTSTPLFLVVKVQMKA